MARNQFRRLRKLKICYKNTSLYSKCMTYSVNRMDNNHLSPSCLVLAKNLGIKGPRTLHKVVIVHTHFNFFSQLQGFSQFYIWTTIFPTIFLEKSLWKIFVACKDPYGYFDANTTVARWNYSWFLFQLYLLL